MQVYCVWVKKRIMFCAVLTLHDSLVLGICMWVSTRAAWEKKMLPMNLSEANSDTIPHVPRGLAAQGEAGCRRVMQ